MQSRNPVPARPPLLQNECDAIRGRVVLLIDVNFWVALAHSPVFLGRHLQLTLYYHVSASFNVADGETVVNHVNQIADFWTSGRMESRLL